MELNNKKRIVKNSLYLNVRMVIALLVSLYTSRVVLQVLGFTDYGIYNVVFGFVSMFMVLNSSIQTGTQRFLSFGIGKGNREYLKKVFSNALILHLFIAFLTFILLETIGLWFAYYKLNIPEERFEISMWVYQIVVFGSCITIMGNPYQSVIISNERMGAYALLTTLNIVLKLVVVFLISIMPFSHLLSYALLLFIVTIIIQTLFAGYCIRNFPECKTSLQLDRRVLQNLCAFSGWMIVGTTSNTLTTHGVNVLINIFFSPVFNASRSIAIQVKDALNSFVGNMMTAVNPQIIKLHAQKDWDGMLQLVYTSSKLSFIILFAFSIPFFLYADEFLHLWLGKVPPLCPLFLRLTLVEACILCLYTPISQISQASGKIKYYQFTISGVFVATFILSCAVFLLRFNVYSVFVVAIFMAIVGLFCRLLILRKINDFDIGEYMRKVLMPMPMLVCVPFLVVMPFLKMLSHNYLSMTLISGIGVVTCLSLFWLIAMQGNEREFVTNIVKNRILRRAK